MAVVTSLGQRNKEDNISQGPKKHAKIKKTYFLLAFLIHISLHDIVSWRLNA